MIWRSTRPLSVKTPVHCSHFTAVKGKVILDIRMFALIRFWTMLNGASSSEQAAQLYREAEELLIGSYSVLPLYTSPLYFISGDRISGAFYSPYTGFIDFSGAVLSAK